MNEILITKSCAQCGRIINGECMACDERSRHTFAPEDRLTRLTEFCNREIPIKVLHIAIVSTIAVAVLAAAFFK